MKYGVYAHLDGGMYWKTAVIDNNLEKEEAERLAEDIRQKMKEDKTRSKRIGELFNNWFLIDIIVEDAETTEKRKVKQYIEPYNTKIVKILTE